MSMNKTLPISNRISFFTSEAISPRYIAQGESIIALVVESKCVSTKLQFI
jgi:hypothetical protein